MSLAELEKKHWQNPLMNALLDFTLFSFTED